MRNIKDVKYDVTIVGGGPAGVSCAYTAAKLGLKTLLVEKNNYLGGQMTGALVIPMMISASDNINTEFYTELVSAARKSGAQATYLDGNDGWFNPCLMKIVLDEMLKEAGADILFEAELFGAEIKPCAYETCEKYVNYIKVRTKTLSIHIYSKYFVDTTGDSSLCEILNCNFIDDKNKFQPDSLRFIVSGINLDKFSKQILELDPDRNVTTAQKLGNSVHLSTACTFDTDKNWALWPLFKKAVDEGVLEYSDTAYFQVFTVAGMPNSLAFNCPRLENYSNDDPLAYSNAIIGARMKILRLFNFVKKYFDGFENSYISQIADTTGVRISKRPITKYIYKKEDLISGKVFDNPVLTADYPIDIHSNDKNSSQLNAVQKYFLPVECLICDDFGNLFVAGRNVGAEFEAQAALRIQKSCLSMGEALAKHLFRIN